MNDQFIEGQINNISLFPMVYIKVT